MSRFLFFLTGPTVSELHRDELRAYGYTMFRAGVLLADATLAAPENGFSLTPGSEPATLAAPPAELTAFWVVDVSNHYEAREWATRAPLAVDERLDALRIHRDGEESTGTPA